MLGKALQENAAKDPHTDPSFSGAITLSLSGDVESSTGSLQGSSDSLSKAVIKILRDTNAALVCAGQADPLRRISIKSGNRELVIAIANGKILIGELAQN